MNTKPFYDSAARPAPMKEELLDLIRFWDLARALIWNGLKTRYKRSVLGVAWTLLNPLVTTVVTTIAFSHLFKSDITAYPVYVLAGSLLWTFFAQSTGVAMHGLVYTGGRIMRRVYLPRSVYCVVAVGTGFVNLLIGLILLAALAIFFGMPFTPSLLFMPVSLAMTFAFVLGAALFFSAIAIFFTDMIEIFHAATMAIFYLTPVLYPKHIIPDKFAWIAQLNPMLYHIECFRAPIHSGTLPDAHTVLMTALTGLCSLVFGWWFFTSRMDEISVRT